jgi:hypothetical protein
VVRALTISRYSGRYILDDPATVPMLLQLRAAGKRVFLLTNSLWDYTSVVMEHIVSIGCDSAPLFGSLVIVDDYFTGTDTPGCAGRTCLTWWLWVHASRPSWSMIICRSFGWIGES